MASLQFAPWSSDIELSFYAALASLKIDKDRLDDSVKRVLGIYEVKPSDAPERSARMQIHGGALTADQVPKDYIRAEGWMKNYNTMEEFKNVDRAKVIDLAARNVWAAIKDGTIVHCPSLLSAFYAISFANLKKYKFFYHYVFPALHSDPAWKFVDGTQPTSLTPDETYLLSEAVSSWKYKEDSRQHGFFLARKERSPWHADENDLSSWTSSTPTPQSVGFQWIVRGISAFKEGFFTGVAPEDCFIAFVDPSTYPTNPGWMLRNYLVMIRHLWGLHKAQILCYRDTHNTRDQPHSIVLQLETSPDSPPLTDMPKATGWERNTQGKVGVRTIDLAAYMEPSRLADQAVDLNLKLIKWRIAPSIDLDIIKDTSCLLLGAGTLGTYVSRNLMGWGVRKITFVDSGTVSYSNPVRQPLFRFEDCVDGGKFKATRAAEALKEIYPGVEARGEIMNVPMVGHPMLDVVQAKKDFDKLRELIAEHDAVFLLLDSRESRWLPTVMGKSASKIVINAALGFENFLVMRHGLTTISPEEGEIELGCYFCNDIVVPVDSQKNATLDQQCTVTRPGVAPIASALAVELLVSILQHPLGVRAPPSDPKKNFQTPPSMPIPVSNFQHPLGDVPHSIRGYLSSFSNMQIIGQPYKHCSACSEAIIRKYEHSGWNFIRDALSKKGFVEEVSGLAEIQRQAEKAEADLEAWEEDEDDDGEML